jgi:hypothetical protein
MFSKIAMAAIVANFANAINIQAYKGTATHGNGPATQGSNTQQPQQQHQAVNGGGNNNQQPQQHQAMNGGGNNTQQPQQNPPTHKDWKKFMKTHKKAVKNAMKAFPNVVKSLEKKYP